VRLDTTRRRLRIEYLGSFCEQQGARKELSGQLIDVVGTLAEVPYGIGNLHRLG